MASAVEFVIEDGVLVKYKGKGGDIVIPEGVTTIGKEAFRGKKKITGVVVPEGVREIGNFAFCDCIKLERVQLPQSLEMVRMGAFVECRNLTELIFPQSAQFENPDWTVDLSVRLQHVEFPVTMHFTPRWEEDLLNLEGCSGLSDLVCPGVSMNLVAPKRKLAAIQGYICHTEKYTDAEVRQSYDSYLFKQKKNLLPLIWKFDAAHILKILADNGKLTAKTLEAEYLEPASKANAIQCVSFLLDWKNANAGADKPRRAPKSELDKDPYSAGEMRKIWSTQKLEDGTLEITSYKGDSTEVEVPPRIGKTPVTRIGELAFSPYKTDTMVYQKPYDRYRALKAIRSVSLPESITAIGKCAFAGCSALTEIHIPGSVTQIGDQAFAKCTSLKQIALPAEVKRIGYAAFRDCEQLCSVSLSAELEAIGEDAFSGCGSLREISLPEALKMIGQSSFAGCDALAGENHLVIVNQTVQHCHPDAENVVIPDGVTGIGRDAFDSCRKLKNLVIPSSVTRFGYFLGGDWGYLFNACKKHLTIYAQPNSCAAKYAKTNGITVKYIKDGELAFDGE